MQSISLYVFGSLSATLFLDLTLSQTSPCFHMSAVRRFRKHCGKRRNCLLGEMLGEISPVSTVFSTILENFVPFSSTLKLLSASSFSLEESKICPLGKCYVVMFGSEVKGGTCDRKALCSSLTGTTGSLVGGPLGKTLQSPSKIQVKARKYI